MWCIFCTTWCRSAGSPCGLVPESTRGTEGGLVIGRESLCAMPEMGWYVQAKEARRMALLALVPYLPTNQARRAAGAARQPPCPPLFHAVHNLQKIAGEFSTDAVDEKICSAAALESRTFMVLVLHSTSYFSHTNSVLDRSIYRIRDWSRRPMALRTWGVFGVLDGLRGRWAALA